MHWRLMTFKAGIQHKQVCKALYSISLPQPYAPFVALCSLLLPSAGNPERFSSASLASYEKLLGQETKKVEKVLQILMSPPGDKNLVPNYADLVPHPSIPDFIKLMDLKGMKKAEIGPLVDQLGLHKKVSKTEYADLEEDLDLQPQEMGTGSVFAGWKRTFGDSIKMGTGKELALGLGKELLSRT